MEQDVSWRQDDNTNLRSIWEAPPEKQDRGCWHWVLGKARHSGQLGTIGAVRGLTVFTVDIEINYIIFISVEVTSAVFIFPLKLHSYTHGKEKENCKTVLKKSV